MKLDQKITEASNIKSKDLDKKSILDILNIFNAEDEIVVKAVKDSINGINKIITLAISTLKNNGRLFYVGAGTSGRLGILDASECVPTFSVNSDLFQGVIAGGEQAMFKSIENAEDDITEIRDIISDKSITSNDIVIGISCSGDAPFVLEFLNQSDQLGASTALITFNDIEDLTFVDTILRVFVGPEIISGSTRMKSGTATKIILNMISTTTMIKLNKTYGNFMVDLKIMNKKLLNRGIHIVQSLTQLDREQSEALLERADRKIKNAIIMHKLDTTYEESEELLKKSNGSLRAIIE
jgi:N-acetylmuramic acid 6-phosphate etherase